MSMNEEDRKLMAERIAKRSRKIGMLVNSERFPEAKGKVRADYKKKEKLSEIRSRIAAKRRSDAS